MSCLTKEILFRHAKREFPGAWGVFDWLWQLQLKALPGIQFAVGSCREKLHALLHLWGKAKVKTSKFYSIRGFSSGLKTQLPQKQLLKTPLGRSPAARCHPVCFWAPLVTQASSRCPRRADLQCTDAAQAWVVADAVAALGPLTQSVTETLESRPCAGAVWGD